MADKRKRGLITAHCGGTVSICALASTVASPPNLHKIRPEKHNAATVPAEAHAHERIHTRRAPDKG